MNKAPCSKVNDGFTKETWSVSGKNNQIQDKVPPIVHTHQKSVAALYVKKIASKEPYFGIARYEHSHTCHVNASLQLILQISNIRKILTENKFRKNTLCSAIKELCIFKGKNLDNRQVVDFLVKEKIISNIDRDDDCARLVSVMLEFLNKELKEMGFKFHYYDFNRKYTSYNKIFYLNDCKHQDEIHETNDIMSLFYSARRKNVGVKSIQDLFD